ncbi:MAG: AAA family ATPase [Gammaproteobacteria bacterium]
MTKDARLNAFCSAEVLDCFQSIVHESEIWKPDPYDVESIHSHAREVFERLLNQIKDERAGTGKIWLLKGESGAGKTHLMRVFRNRLHETGYGYFSYMQMTSAESNYPRYILRQTLDSLEKPYVDDPTGSVTGLMRLSRALVEERRAVSRQEQQKLCEAEMGIDEVIEFVDKLAYQLVNLEEYKKVDRDLLRALLFLQRDEVEFKSNVMKYLRCEDISERDRQWIGMMPALTADDDPQRLLQGLACLIWALDAGVLVICLDQLEDMYRDNTESAQRFRNAIQTVKALASYCPRLLILVSCLEDYYAPLRNQLSQSDIDRIEHDPQPTRLNAILEREATEALIARRLEVLYDFSAVAFDNKTPLYPFPDGVLDALAGLRVRDILNRCRELREQSIMTQQAPVLDGVPIDVNEPPGTGNTGGEPFLEWEQRWNDFLVQATLPPPDNDNDMQQVLVQTLNHCTDELSSYHVSAQPAKGGITLVISAHEQTSASSFVGLCNKSAIGGALGKQLREVEVAAAGKPLIIARSTAFPSNPNTKIAQQIVQLISQGVKRVVIEDSDWRAMAAMQAFKVQHLGSNGFAGWLAASQPLSLRPALKTILGLEVLGNTGDPGPPEPPIPDDPNPIDPAAIQLGQSRDFKPVPVILGKDDLTRHAAFLGGSGSGKTTLALNIIEQLLQQGIPALLIDRKGDLSSYAKLFQATQAAGMTSEKDNNPALQRFLAQIDVALYTPGNARGRPLGIPIIPKGMGELPTNEREQMAAYAALALGGMMNYRPQGLAKTRLAILNKAIFVLAELSAGLQIGLDDLIEFIASENSELIYAIGQLETRHFKKLVEDLETLRLLNGKLFTEQRESLDCETLLGLGSQQQPDRTRLSIISTLSLGHDANVLFWVSQLLLELGRYARRQPANQLQCVVLFDEADLYLPATGKPATKEPLENLLRRARSAGIGLMLATQSPGDLDYKSRDQISNWFLGKIKESTALNKLKPMLSEAKTDIEARLPTQETGQFYVIREGQVSSLQARRSLVNAEQVPEDEILHLAQRLNPHTS